MRNRKLSASPQTSDPYLPMSLAPVMFNLVAQKAVDLLVQQNPGLDIDIEVAPRKGGPPSRFQIISGGKITGVVDVYDRAAEATMDDFDQAVRHLADDILRVYRGDSGGASPLTRRAASRALMDQRAPETATVPPSASPAPVSPPGKFADLIDRMELRGQFRYLGQWIPEPDPEELQAYTYVMKDHLPEARLDELFAGAEASEAERALWREIMIESAFVDLDAAYMAAIYRVATSGDADVWGATIHGDHGIIEYSFGPYPTEDQLLEALQLGGVFRRG